MSFPWTEDGDGSVGRVRPEAQNPLVALYDGFGYVGNARKPMVIASLGSGDGSFLVCWRVFDDNRNVWEVNTPNDGTTFLRCVGRRLYLGTYNGLRVMDAVTGMPVYTFDPNREYMTCGYLVTAFGEPKPRRRGGWTIPDETVKTVVFGSKAGGMFAFSLKVRCVHLLARVLREARRFRVLCPHPPAPLLQNRESKIGDVTFLQLGAAHEFDIFQDEVPTHPTYHPPGSGGLSGLMQTSANEMRWRKHTAIHTRATRWQELAARIDFGLEALLWVLVMLQISYFPLRAKFPALMAPWQTLARALATFNFSAMSGADSFEPAYSKSVFLIAAVWLVVTAQVTCVASLPVLVCPHSLDVWLRVAACRLGCTSGGCTIHTLGSETACVRWCSCLQSCPSWCCTSPSSA